MLSRDNLLARGYEEFRCVRQSGTEIDMQTFHEIRELFLAKQRPTPTLRSRGKRRRTEGGKR
jgi:hypothetical protein